MSNSLDEEPSLKEVQEAIKQMSRGKAPGQDSIPAEIYSLGGDLIQEKLHALYIQIWHQEHLPQDMKDATIVHIYKKKGDKKICNNHRPWNLAAINQDTG